VAYRGQEGRAAGRIREDAVSEAGPDYEPVPPFAPPAQRTAPLNELEVLGRSSYGPAEQPSVPWQPSPYPPVAWHPAHRYPAGGDWQHSSRLRSSRRRTVAIVAATVVALIGIVGALLIGNVAHTTRSLSLPRTAGDYTRLTTISGTHLRSMFGAGSAFSAIPPDDLDAAKVAVYGRGPQQTPSLLFVGFVAADSPNIGRQLRSEDSAQVTSDVLLGAGASLAPLPVDAGPLGGSLECSSVDVDGLSASVGVWADSDTLGMILLFDPSLTPSREQTGDVTRSFRASAEH
jgi:hypothetical protein